MHGVVRERAAGDARTSPTRARRSAARADLLSAGALRRSSRRARRTRSTTSPRRRSCPDSWAALAVHDARDRGRRRRADRRRARARARGARRDRVLARDLRRRTPRARSARTRRAARAAPTGPPSSPRTSSSALARAARRAAPLLGDPLQPRVAAARAGVRHAQGDAAAARDQPRPPASGSRSGTSTRCATGRRRATSSRACG